MIEKAFAKGIGVDGAEVLFTEIPPGTGGELSQGAVALTVNWTKKRLLKGDKAMTGDAILVPYCPNGINYVVPNGNDVISAKFTGCWMAKYSIGGGARVAHVATPECNTAWASLQGQPGFQMIAAFKPADHIDFAGISKLAGKLGAAGGEIIGIITGDNRCFAIGAVKQMVSGVTSLTVVSNKHVA